MSDYIPSDHVIPYITSDHVIQILKRLPVKTLLRFRCVCKLWKEIIDSSSFMLEHLAVQNPNFLAERKRSELFVVDPNCTHPLVDRLMWDKILDHVPAMMPKFNVVGTLHGVICLHDICLGFALWNPSIHKVLYRPFPKIRGVEWPVRVSYGCHAFWIDPSSKEFKFLAFNAVVWDSNVDDDDEEEDEDVEEKEDRILFSSTEMAWRLYRPGVVLCWEPIGETPALMIKGIAYWVGIYKEGHDKQRLNVMLSFDFVQESFDFIGIPTRNPFPCQWRGNLSLLCKDEIPPHRCDLYSREENSWIKMFSFNLISPVTRAFWVLGEMEERAKFLAETSDQELVLYQIGVGCIPLVSRFWANWVAYGFVESLLFPDFDEDFRPIVSKVPQSNLHGMHFVRRVELP